MPTGRAAETWVSSDHWPADQVVFHCTFDQANWDKNFDHWPDRWVRHQGPGYPFYVEIKRIDEPTAPGGAALQVKLDGGAAAVLSPLIPVRSVYAYVVEVFVKTHHLQHHQAYVSLQFLDPKLQVVGRQESEKRTGTRSWERLCLGPVEVPTPEACWVRIGLHVEPGQQADLKGEAGFAQVCLGRLPRLRIWVPSRTHLFAEGDQVEMVCQASGFSNPDCLVEWRLYDVWGRLLSQQRQSLQAEVVPASLLVSSQEDSSGEAFSQPKQVLKGATTSRDEFLRRGQSSQGDRKQKHLTDPNPTEDSSGSSSAGPVCKPETVYRGKTLWRPILPGAGFYRVSCRLVGISGQCPSSELDLAIVGPGFSVGKGEFGWSLPEGDKPLPLEELAPLLKQIGVRWIKYPVWFDLKAEATKVDAWVVFSERLNAQGIEIVGMLARPPGSLAKQFAAHRPLAADIFAMDPARWWPAVEGLLLRFAPRIHWWQLGLDDDPSFVGLPGLEEKLRRVKAHWDKVGKDLQIGFSWDWVHEVPECRGGSAPWKFLSFRSEPPLTAEELAVGLAQPSPPGLLRWVAVEPLPKDQYSLEERAADLVGQMVAAKIGGADVIFLPDPFHRQTGLMNPDGTVAELLLVWRTVAQALSGARYLGSLPMPNRSPNHLFLREKEALLILWNDRPTEEQLYLGEQVQQVDLWGRTEPLPKKAYQHHLHARALPVLLRGLDPLVAQWRIHCQIATTRIPSLFGRPHRNHLKMHNPLDRGVSGIAKLIVPQGWMVQPSEIVFRLGPGENLEAPFSIVLPYTATNGQYPLVVELRLQADRAYQFQVHRWVDVGLGDVYIQVAARLNRQQELEVEQRLVNETEQSVGFECQLFAPGRKRLRTQVFLSGPGEEVYVYRFPQGQELVGKTLWLQAVEVGGQRVLTYRFPVLPDRSAGSLGGLPSFQTIDEIPARN
ncbi:MAG: NEW3 domain-containing protein [Thermoguttaceae bacterium]|nr:NEW3 domain-containing protein [Thermoguttaceae bacterium]